MNEPNKRSEVCDLIQRTTRLMFDLGLSSLTHYMSDLECLMQRLLTGDMGEDEGEAEYYAVMHSHPVLRRISQYLVQEDLVIICSDGLDHYISLARERALTPAELEWFQNVREQYDLAISELKQVWNNIVGDEQP